MRPETSARRARAVIEHQLLSGEPARALHEAALDLAEIDGRIQRAAHVMQDVHAQHAVLAGERVNSHLCHGHTIGEIEEWAAMARRLVPVDLRRGVIAGRGQRHAPGVGQRGGLSKREGLAACLDPSRPERDLTRIRAGLGGKHACQPLLDRLRRGPRCHAVEVGARGGRRRGGVGYLARVGGGDAHMGEVALELLRHHLRHLLIEPLAHLRAAVVQVERAVGVEVQQGARLVHLGEGERDAELHGAECNAALEDGALCVPLPDRRPPALIAGRPHQLVRHRADDAVLELLPEGRGAAA